MLQIAKESDVVSPTTVIADLVTAFSHICSYAGRFGEKELFEYIDKMDCRKIATVAAIWITEASNNIPAKRVRKSERPLHPYHLTALLHAE